MKLFETAKYKGFHINKRHSAALCFHWHNAIFPRKVAFYIALYQYGYKEYSKKAEHILKHRYNFTRNSLIVFVI